MLSLALFVGLILPAISINNSKNVDINAALKDNLQNGEAAAVLDLKSNKIWVYGEDYLTKLHRPGSVFKLISAASFITYGLADERIECHGETNFQGQSNQQCWNRRGHGLMDLKQAIIHSCNIYFYSVAAKLPASGLWQQMSYWALDRPSGFSYKEDWPQVNQSLTAVQNGDCAIGDCDQILISGYSLLKLAAILSRNWSKAGNIEVPEELGQSMLRVVEQGTASEKKSSGLSYAGKTGTARQIGSYRYEGWFIGFFPFEKPQYAIVVYKSKGVGKDSAAIADKLIGVINDAASHTR